MWLEALLGGVAGASDNYTSRSKKKEELEFKDQEKKAQFKQDLLKGMILQSAKPKSNPITFGDDLLNSLDPETRAYIQQIKVGGAVVGGAGRGKAPRTNNPPPVNNPFANPQGSSIKTY